jgi:hypothetical protein
MTMNLVLVHCPYTVGDQVTATGRLVTRLKIHAAVEVMGMIHWNWNCIV